MVVDLTEIGKYIIGLLAAIIEVFLIPYLKNKYDVEKIQKTMNNIKVAVQAAEQIFGSGKGAEKKEYVKQYLAKKNIKLDENALDASIESAVLEMNKQLLNE